MSTDRERIIMELYTAAYLTWLPRVKEYTGNVAEEMAKKAVSSFNKEFSINITIKGNAHNGF